MRKALSRNSIKLSPKTTYQPQLFWPQLAFIPSAAEVFSLGAQPVKQSVAVFLQVFVNHFTATLRYRQGSEAQLFSAILPEKFPPKVPNQILS